MDILFAYPTREGFPDLKIYASGKFLVPPLKLNVASAKLDFGAGNTASQRYRVGKRVYISLQELDRC
jgi:hypothetical protein